MIKVVIYAAYAATLGYAWGLTSRDARIHECVVTSDNRRNRGQNRSNLSSSVNGVVNARDNVATLRKLASSRLPSL